jgi:hypothetical protein
MSNLYKNPLTPEQLNGAQSVSRTETFGTNFSVLGIGGFMEVYNISDLDFTIPPATTGPIELSGNTIPISFLKGSGPPFSYDVLTLGSDNISSGRRRLGMLVYVYETNQVYQHTINNYDSLWNSATAATNTVTISDFGTTVNNSTPEGQSFIDSWTASTVEGISGVTRSAATWRKYYGNDLSITGGTFDSFTGTLNLVNVTGGTVPITGISGGGGGGGITGGSFIYSAQTLELYSSGGTLSITGFSDVYVTGGTYSAGTITFTNNSGGTFNVTGIPTGGGVSGNYLPLSGGTVSGNTIFTSGLTATTISATTYYNLPYSGTVSGSGTTNKIPVWVNSTTLGDSQIDDDGTNVTIGGNLTTVSADLLVNQGITATTISATTYYNLPIDPDTYVTGFTLTSDIITLSQNRNDQYSAFTISLSAYTGGTGVSGDYLPLSGGTVTGLTNFNSGLTSNSITSTTISATTYLNVPNYNTGVIINSDLWINNNNGTISLPTTQVGLYSNTAFTGSVEVYVVSSGTTGSGGIPSLSDNDTNYVVIDYNGGSPIYNVLTDNSTINSSDIVLYLIVYRAGNFVHVLDFGNEGAGLPNKLNDRIIAVDRFARESGFSLGLSGSTGVVTLSSGVAWNGTNRQSLVAVNSQDDVFFQSFHTGGTWTYTTSANTLNNLYYDDGTNPVLATSGKYLVNWYFRGQEVNDHLYEVWGNDEYDNVSEAQLSTEPSLPELITSHAFLTGRIIVQVSATTGVVESAFVQVFQPTTVQSHNDLTGLQGGSINEYYHLTSFQYNNLSSFKNIQINGVTQFSSTTLTDNLNFSGINVNITSSPTNTLVFSANTGGGLAYYISGSTPSGSINNGDRWFDTNSGLELVYINDGDSSQWVQPNSSPGSFTGNTSATCISQLYVTNVYGCSPINFNDPVNLKEGVTVSGITTFNGPVNLNIGLTATTISATTYQNLPTDIRTTGGTYSNNTFTFTNNTGGTYSVLFNTVTGLTVNGILTVTGNTSLQNLTASTISSTTINVNSATISGTKGTVTTSGSSTTAFINVTGSNTVGGTGYTDFIRVTNTAAGATNINKTIRANITGSIEFLNSAYNALTFSIADNGIVTINSPASVTSNSAIDNALNVGTKGQLFDDGNFHIHSSSGAVWINSLDGSAIRLGTQTNSGNSPVIVDTSTVGHSFFTKVQSGFNVAFGTEITMDNLKVRINGTGGSGGLVQGGAVSGSFAAYTTLLGNVAGSALQGDTNSGGITFTTTYQNISGSQKTLSAGGDVTELHLIDTTNSRIYRITAIHCQDTTGGYTSIERMA